MAYKDKVWDFQILVEFNLHCIHLLGAPGVLSNLSSSSLIKTKFDSDTNGYSPFFSYMQQSCKKYLLDEFQLLTDKCLYTENSDQK